MDLIRLAPLAAVALSATASAGIFGSPPEFTLMQVGRGYLDVQDPFGSGINTASITNPPVGSFLLLGGGIPGVERFLSQLSYSSSETTFNGYLSTFNFRNEVEVDPFSLPESEYAFAGNRLEFTTAGPSTFTVFGDVDLVGGGALFVYDYSNPSSLLIMDVPVEAFGISIELSAGNNTIAWGVLAESEGGLGDWEGSATLLAIPAPGAAALLALAGLIIGHRRRR